MSKESLELADLANRRISQNAQVNLESSHDKPPGPAKLSLGARPEVFKSTLHEIICVAVLTFGVALYSITSGSLQTITSTIGRELNMTTPQITWLTSAPTLTAGSFLLLFGALADIIGRKHVLLASFVLYIVLCLVAGFSKEGITLDVFRGLQGLCAAASVPASVGILGSIYAAPSVRKNRAFAAFSAGNPVGFSIGAISSGIATQILNWRSALWFYAILYAIFTVLAYFCIPADPKRDLAAIKLGLKQLDYIGAFLVTCGLLGITSALTIGSDAPQGWKTPYVIAVLVLGVLLLAAFLYWQTICRNPLLPLNIFFNLQFSLLTLICTLGLLSFAPGIFWISLLMQEVKDWSPLHTAVGLTPQMVFGVIVNIIAAITMHRIDNRILLYIGVGGFVVSGVLYSFVDATNSYWAFLFPGALLSVLGADLTYNVANVYILQNTEPSRQSLAGGVFNSAQELGAAIGAGIQTAIFTALAPHSSQGYARNTEHEPYQAIFLTGAGISALAVFLVPFVRVGKQGSA